MCKKILAVLLLIFVVSASLSACKLRDNGDAGGEDDAGEVGTIYSPDVSAMIIKSESESIPELRPVFNRLYELTGQLMTITTDSSAKEGTEIVFGNTNRKISSDALATLNKKIALATRDSEDENAFVDDYIGYAVYSDGDSVAIVWSNDYAAEMAVNDFISRFLVSDRLELEEGYIHTNIFSLIAHKKSLEEAEREEMFKEIEARSNSTTSFLMTDIIFGWQIFMTPVSTMRTAIPLAAATTFQTADAIPRVTV